MKNMTELNNKLAVVKDAKFTKDGDPQNLSAAIVAAGEWFLYARQMVERNVPMSVNGECLNRILKSEQDMLDFGANAIKQSNLTDALRERTENSMDKSTADALEAQNRDMCIALESMLDYATRQPHSANPDENIEEWYAARDFAQTTLRWVKESGQY